MSVFVQFRNGIFEVPMKLMISEAVPQQMFDDYDGISLTSVPFDYDPCFNENPWLLPIDQFSIYYKFIDYLGNTEYMYCLIFRSKCLGMPYIINPIEALEYQKNYSNVYSKEDRNSRWDLITRQDILALPVMPSPSETGKRNIVGKIIKLDDYFQDEKDSKEIFKDYRKFVLGRLQDGTIGHYQCLSPKKHVKLFNQLFTGSIIFIQVKDSGLEVKSSPQVNKNSFEDDRPELEREFINDVAVGIRLTGRKVTIAPILFLTIDNLHDVYNLFSEIKGYLEVDNMYMIGLINELLTSSKFHKFTTNLDMYFGHDYLISEQKDLWRIALTNMLTNTSDYLGLDEIY